MAVQDKYKKQPKLDFTSDEWEDVPVAQNPENQAQNPSIDFNSPEFQSYNPNVEIQQPVAERPEIEKDISAFGTGGINMAGLRAPITGALTGAAGLIGKALGKNDKSFWENYQAGKDFVTQQNDQAKEDNPTAYYTGNLATGLALAKGANSAAGGLIGKALTSGKVKALGLVDKLPIAETLKTVASKVGKGGAKKAITSYLAFKGLDTLADKLFESKSNYGGSDGTNY